jgi:hypothetical protein
VATSAEARVETREAMVRTAWMSERLGGEEEGQGWREVKMAVAFERFSLRSLVTLSALTH